MNEGVRPQPIILTILDGWGHREELAHNAIAQASTPNWDALLKHYPHRLIEASEGHVGLPEGQMGNSEVGHMNIGAGRLILQDLPRIDDAVQSGALAQNKQLLVFIDALKASGGACHLMGLLSPGGVHSHQRHIATLARIVSGAGIQVYIHAFLDGRDTPPQSALDYIHVLEAELTGSKVNYATVSGRYYAMDRDKRWERIQLAYNALVSGEGANAATQKDTIEQNYRAGTGDEFIKPTILPNYAGMKDGDGILMANFRADRARQMLTALLDPDFTGFSRSKTVRIAAAAGMVEYSEKLNPFITTLFPPETPRETLGEVVAGAGLTQLRIAETEKYAHVTFFFNGGREEPFAGESRILVPSPNVATYDLKPEMSAYEMTDKLVEAIESGTFDLIVVNYANTDMVGHSGNIIAAKQAVEAVDLCLGRIHEAVKKTGGAWVITADHGNAEMMHDDSGGQPHTAHTLNQVPLVIASAQKITLRGGTGQLADVAPTLLSLLHLKQPSVMQGQSLIAGGA